MRLILYAGKGGVGKTSVSAATGLALAERGYRTLVMSLDPAHSLADVFDLPVALMDKSQGRPVEVAERLAIQELDIQQEIERYWGDVYAYVATLIRTTGIEDVVADELAIIPGMEEVSSLLYINRYARDEAYDVVLLDCAPTGESLRFISMPTALDWYMRRVFRLERNLFRVARPMVKPLTNLPLPDDKYFANIASLFEKLDGVQNLLTDPARTTVRLVTNAEKIVVKETQRAYMYFCLYGMTVDAVVVNRMIPDAAGDGLLARWREIQEGYFEEIRAAFAPVQLWTVPLFDHEVLGVEGLAELGRRLYSPDFDPATVLQSEPPHRFIKENGRVAVVVSLPFIRAGDVDLNRVGDELIIRIGGFKRHVLLPRSFAGHAPTGADFSGGKLTVEFAARAS